MFVLQKRFIFARGLNWDQSCLWKTPSSHVLLFYRPWHVNFFNFFSSPHSWGVKKPSCKNWYIFGENWQRNQFPKLDTFFIDFSLMLQLCHSALLMHRSWCTRVDALERMHLSWCTRAEALELIHLDKVDKDMMDKDKVDRDKLEFLVTSRKPF